MGFFTKKAKDSPVGLYGKHPAAGDFIRMNAGGSNLRAFDEWLSAGLAAAQKVSSDWASTYTSGPILSFLFMAPVGRGPLSALCGRMAPSQDQSGRLFPLLIFCDFEGEPLARDYPVLPQTHYFEEIGTLLGRRASLDRDGLLQETQRLAPVTSSLQDAERRQQKYLDETDCGTAFGSIFGAESGARGAAAVAALADVCRSGGSNFAVRCPLGSSPASEAGLWLQLVQSLGRGRLAPSAIWDDHSLLISLGKLPARSLLVHWGGLSTDDSIYDLTTAKATSNALPGDQPLRTLLAGTP